MSEPPSYAILSNINKEDEAELAVCPTVTIAMRFMTATFTPREIKKDKIGIAKIDGDKYVYDF